MFVSANERGREGIVLVGGEASKTGETIFCCCFRYQTIKMTEEKKFMTKILADVFSKLRRAGARKRNES